MTDDWKLKCPSCGELIDEVTPFKEIPQVDPFLHPDKWPIVGTRYMCKCGCTVDVPAPTPEEES